MINLTGVSKNYGKKVLFDGISLSINRQEKIGLLGPNGTGKSTLFAMILGDVEPSSGEIHVLKNIRVGYLPQEASFHSSHTVLGELLEGDKEINQLNQEKAQLEKDDRAGSQRYGEILERLEALDYFNLDHKAKKILSGLGFKESDFTRPIRELSGGWQMRTLLAKLLTCHYDLLLLDEPTNYLDLNAALWLKNFLTEFDGTFIMISHDKAFLNEVTNYTLILENGSIFKVRGNYEHYEQIKAERRTFLLKQFKEQEKKREQLQTFVARFHAQPNKAASVRAKRTTLEKMEKEQIVLPPDPRQSIGDFRFPAARSSGHRMISLEQISKSYGAIQVYKDFDFEIFNGEKAVLAGENGAGKSTLLKIMAGVIDIDSGVRKPGHNVDIGYFSQTRLDVLNPDNTVLREAYSAAPGYMSETTVRTILGAFLFTGDDADKTVKVLSGGEKSRLILAKLLIDPPNFLLLDEPTTHLDVDAVDALINALTQYQGSIVFISHDIHFVRSVANVVYDVKAGQVKKISGNFDYYLEKKARGELGDQASPAMPRPHEKHHKAVDLQRLKAKEDQKTLKQEERKRKIHNSELRARIVELEKQKERLNLEMYAKARALSDPRLYRRDDDTARDYGRRMKEIEKLMQELDAQILALEGMMLQ